MSIIQEIEQKYMKKDLPEFDVGDTVKVYAKIIEGDKERIQGFEGIVIKKEGSGIKKNFTVRKIVDGVGVERIFPLHSPKLERVEVTKKGKVRRAKLYYLRRAKGKRARLKKKEFIEAVAEKPGLIENKNVGQEIKNG